MAENKGNLIPSGVILMWSGLKANIPLGFKLCDGTLGTPDLRDKFIASISASEEAGVVGGAASLTHSGSAVADHAAGVTGANSGAAVKVRTSSSNAAPNAHTHSTPALTHVVTQPSAHADSRPPFYKLCFIMKS